MLRDLLLVWDMDILFAPKKPMLLCSHISPEAGKARLTASARPALLNNNLASLRSV